MILQHLTLCSVAELLISGCGSFDHNDNRQSGSGINASALLSVNTFAFFLAKLFVSPQSTASSEWLKILIHFIKVLLQGTQQSNDANF